MVLEDADGSASAMAIKMVVCALFVTSLLFVSKGQTSFHFPYTPWIPFISRLLYMKCNASLRHKRHINSLGHSPHLCMFCFHLNLNYILVFLLSGDIKLNIGPEDDVSESSEESDLLLQCD